MKRYEVINHTADIGIKAYGKDLKELFTNAAFGLFEIMADLKNVRIKEKIKINIKAPSIEELFLSYLSELIYQAGAKKIIFKEILIDNLDETSVSAQACGEKLDLGRHKLKREIKAVTYHQLKVEKIKDKWQGEVIFDV